MRIETSELKCFADMKTILKVEKTKKKHLSKSGIKNEFDQKNVLFLS